ncbi:MAG: hypothetical protein ABII18_12000 [bacterium]|nr:hypothetical protein [bacterium]MBU1918332.1 hypothetical protein [bacterium]
MNDKKLNIEIEKKIDQFLSESHANVPKAPQNEEDLILKAIMEKGTKHVITEPFITRLNKTFSFHIRWLVPAAAAGMIAFFIYTNFIPQNPTATVSDETVATYFDEVIELYDETIYEETSNDEDFYYEEDNEYASVANDYFYLADMIAEDDV